MIKSKENMYLLFVFIYEYINYFVVQSEMPNLICVFILLCSRFLNEVCRNGPRKLRLMIDMYNMEHDMSKFMDIDTYIRMSDFKREQTFVNKDTGFSASK
jgi:hypothetical protein